MLITQSGHSTYIMAAYDSLQYPYLATLDLKTSEHINIYHKSINGLSERYRYDLTSSNWTNLYHELEYDVNKFSFNVAVQVVKARDPGNLHTEFKNVIHSYTSIIRSMIDSHFENLWSNKSVAGLERLPTEYYGAAPDYGAKQALISQQHLRSKIMGLWINNFLTTEDKRKLRAFRTS